MKKSSYSVLMCSVPCSPGPGGSGNISNVCSVCSTGLYLPCYPSGQSSGEVVFACCGRCLVPVLNVAHFNYMCSGLLVK